MTEVLHAGALAASALGTCCVALDRTRPRVREALLSLVMLAAMIDVAGGLGIVPVVWWSAATLGFALALAIRRRRGSETRTQVRARVHSAIGGVLMATLMLAMGGIHAQPVHHGGSPVVFGAALVIAAVGYAVASVPWRGHVPGIARIQYASMGASVLLLGLGTLA